jgi:hypothetical protein
VKGIQNNVRDVDALTTEEIANVYSEFVVAKAANPTRMMAQTRQTDGDVGF